MSEINWIHNIPFFCIFIAMFSSIITALIKNGVAMQSDADSNKK